MTKLLHLFATFSLVLACGIASAAQTNQQESTSPNGTTAELSILIGQRQVKFTPLRQAQELRLEVFNNAGELLYDSGSLTEAELNWNLHDGYGNPLAPGLYAYTLSLKVPEAEAPHKHQGHLIIEKGNDQIWLTTKGAGNLGAEVTGGELTIVRHSAGATAGAGYLASGRTLGEGAGIQRDTQGRTLADDKATGADLRLAPNISGSGTTNRVTKWQDGPGGVVGDSVISEVGGNVGIGTGSPAAGLDYRGSTAAFFTRDIGPFNALTAQSALQLGLSNAGSRFAGVGPSFLFFAENSAGNKSFLGRVSGVWENPTAGAEAGAIFFQVRANNFDANALTERMRITASGNVGINTTTPNARLEVVKSSALEDATVTTTAYGDDNAVIGRAANGTASAPSATPTSRSLLFLGGRGHTGSAFTFSRAGINIAASENWTNANNGTRITFDTTLNGSTSRQERMRIDHNGNVGIGTTTPGSRLEVAGAIGAEFQYNLNGNRILHNTGTANLFVGVNAGVGNTNGARNASFGFEAGEQNTSGSNNVFVGYRAGRLTDGGNENTFVGFSAGSVNTSGFQNVAVGVNAGITNTTGAWNTLIGQGADVASGSLTHATAIGAGAVVSTSNTVVLGRNIDTVRMSNVQVTNELEVTGFGSISSFYVDATDLRTNYLRVHSLQEGGASGHVCYGGETQDLIGACVSTRRVKDQIRSFRTGLPLLQRLRPVTFNWKKTNQPDIGLIAEEVAEVEPRLANYNHKTGAVVGVKYDQITAVLINAVKEQQAQIAAQQAQIAAQQRQLGRLKKLVYRKQPRAGLCK